MIHDNLEFHNVAELEERPQGGGVHLHRYPKHVREALDVGRGVAERSAGCEIRFVTDAKLIRFTLLSLMEENEVLVFRGNFFHSRHTLRRNTVETIQFPVNDAFDSVLEASLENQSFSSRVWRLVFGRANIIYYDAYAYGKAFRPPLPSEKPEFSLLAYGSSITHGECAFNHHNCYASTTGRLLGADVINMGLSGSCYVESAIADYFATRNDWSVATLELGINVRLKFTADIFEERATYFINKLANMGSDKKLFVITIFPNHATYYKETVTDSDRVLRKEREEHFNDILRKIVAAQKMDNVFLVEGAEVLTDFSYLTCDLTHPSDYGHPMMGANLARIMRKALKM